MTKKQFNALSKRKQRILVAEDVIAQLKSKKYTAAEGTYVAIDNKKFCEAVRNEENQDKELCDFTEGLKNCEVCARGALFLSTISLGDDFKVSKVNNDHNYEDDIVEIDERAILERVEPVFDQIQQYIIETAFEGEDICDELSNTLYDLYDEEYTDIDGNKLTYDEIVKDCVAFYEKFPDDKKRLIAIMENIIRNDGVFRPVIRTYKLDI